MKEDQFKFLSVLGGLPGRLTAEQVAWILNCQIHDVPVLVSQRWLRPLGTPQPNSVKYFATTDVVERSRDAVWLGKMTNAVGQHWRTKNAAKKRNEESTLDASCDDRG